MFEAKERVERAFAKTQKSAAAGPVIVIDNATAEKPYGFIFFVNTKRYLETEERRYAAIGAGPVVFDREQKQIVMLPTYLDAMEAIAEYEAGRLRRNGYRTPVRRGRGEAAGRALPAAGRADLGQGGALVVYLSR